MTTAQFLSEMKSILVTTSTYLHRNAWTFIFFLGGAYAYSNSFLNPLIFLLVKTAFDIHKYQTRQATDRERINFCTNIDDELFQPSSPRPECPVCLLPFPERDAITYQPCCGKFVCDGCVYSQRVATLNSRTEFCCPFCRDPFGDDANDCIAKSVGARYLEGITPLKKNTKKGLELVKQAAELGSEAAHATLGSAYGYGIYGVEKDMVKAMHHLRLAAIGGMLESRYLLGKAFQFQEADPELAYRHFIIAAEEGHDESLKKVKAGYTEGHVEKDVFAKVLRAHQATKVSVKSEARVKAAKNYHRA